MDTKKLSDNRYFGVLFLLPIFACFIVGGIWLKLMVALMAVRALYEFMVVVANKGIRVQKYTMYTGAVILFALFLLGFSSLKTIAVMILFITTACLILAVISEDHSIVDAAVSIMGYIYCCAYFALILLIQDMPGGRWYVLSIFTIAWGCDTTAYYTGRFLGKRKLIPEVSPKKTVEGALGGTLGGALITMAFSLLLRNRGVEGLMSPLQFLLMGLIGSVFSQVGDLIASVIKRDAGVKDYPKLIPGHGGILDRFDSILMAAVAVFLYLTIVMGY